MSEKYKEEIKKGYLLLEKDDPINAITHLSSLRESYPQEKEVWLHSALIHDSLNEEKRAIPMYLKALDLGVEGKDLRDCLVCLASSYRNIEEPNKALFYLTKAQSLFPNDPVVSSFLSLVLFDLKRFSEALNMMGSTLLNESKNRDLLQYKNALTDKFNELTVTSGNLE